MHVNLVDKICCICYKKKGRKVLINFKILTEGGGGGDPLAVGGIFFRQGGFVKGDLVCRR